VKKRKKTKGIRRRKGRRIKAQVSLEKRLGKREEEEGVKRKSREIRALADRD